MMKLISEIIKNLRKKFDWVTEGVTYKLPKILETINAPPRKKKATKTIN